MTPSQWRGKTAHDQSAEYVAVQTRSQGLGLLAGEVGEYRSPSPYGPLIRLLVEFFVLAGVVVVVLDGIGLFRGVR